MDINFKPEYTLVSDAYLGHPPEIFEKKLAYLADMSMKEDWDFKDPLYKVEGRNFPILYNYLNFTYDRLKEENKLAISEDGRAMCFNTGLQTEFEEDIFAYFVKNERYPDSATQQWFFVKFCRPFERELTTFCPLPSIADYFENPSDLIFDKRLLPIRPNYEHIIRDNKERFDAAYHEHELRAAIHGAISIAEERVKRNYKMAIPQFYTDKVNKKSKIQLLLPLCLKDKKIVDLALVVERNGNSYIGRTAIPLDWAYMNSRRIVRPDAEWIIGNI